MVVELDLASSQVEWSVNGSSLEPISILFEPGWIADTYVQLAYLELELDHAASAWVGMVYSCPSEPAEVDSVNVASNASYTIISSTEVQLDSAGSTVILWAFNRTLPFEPIEYYFQQGGGGGGGNGTGSDWGFSGVAPSLIDLAKMLLSLAFKAILHFAQVYPLIFVLISTGYLVSGNIEGWIRFVKLHLEIPIMLINLIIRIIDAILPG